VTLGDFGVAGLALLLVLASTAVGFLLQVLLHEEHRSRDTMDAVRLVMSILITFTAIMLGLLTSTVKSSFDLFDGRMRGYASDFIQLDQSLRDYGEAGDAIRPRLRTYVAAAIADTWRDEPAPSGDYPRFQAPAPDEREPLGALLNVVDDDIRRLEPSDNFHRKLADNLMSRMSDTLAQRWQLIVTAQNTVSMPLIILLLAWLGIAFGVFGLSSPRNVVVYLTILLCAISISSAVYLILDMDSPLDGLIKVSSAPLRDALRHIDAVR
jgi:hypothetical protein